MDDANHIVLLLQRNSGRLGGFGNSLRRPYWDACIVDGTHLEPSTLGMVPAILGMPIALASYGELHGIRFGSIFGSSPSKCYSEIPYQWVHFKSVERSICATNPGDRKYKHLVAAIPFPCIV